MDIGYRLFIIGMCLLVSTMVVATQFALTDFQYEDEVIIPIVPVVPDSGIKLIGSDNSSDNTRVLRIDATDNESYQIRLGNVSSYYTWIYSAAFAIVNEDELPRRITHITVTSSTTNYMKIWLHGIKDANANNATNDPTAVLLYNNGTVVNQSDTTAWRLAAGDEDATTICSNTTDRPRYTNQTLLDSIAGVRYSLNNTNIASGFADYVWVQVELTIPQNFTTAGQRTGIIYIHFESD